MTTAAIDGPSGRSGDAAEPVVEATAEGLDAEVAELREAQSRLRSLLAVSQSLVDSQSIGDVAQQLVEAACATAGAQYARLELDQVGETPGRVLEHAAERRRLSYYRLHREQQVRLDSAPGHRGPRDELSEFNVALDNGRYSLGTLQVLDRIRGGAFTVLTRELLTTLAATGTVLLDRAFHYEQVQRRALWLEAMRRVEELVIRSDDDELVVWSEIADALQRLTASGAVALQIPGEEDDLRVLIAAGTRAEALVGTTFPKAGSLEWQAMLDGRGQVRAEGGPLPPGRPTLVDPELVGPVMAVPLVGASGPRGAVTLVRELGQPTFSAGDLELVEDFARQATVALELAEARSARHRLEHTEAQEAVARELHDHVMQRLFAVGLSLQGVARAEPAEMQRQLQQAVQDLDATIAQIRRTIFTLRGRG